MYKVFFFFFIGCALLILPVLNAFGVLTAWGPAIVLFVIGGTAYVYAAFKYKDLRAIRDTATSKIGSLPMGLVEICGKARRHSNFHAIYRALRVSEKRSKYEFDAGMQGLQREEFSLFPFYIEDSSGSIYVNPEGASILVNVKRWSDGGYRYEEAEIKDGDTVYCLGTVGDKSGDLNAEIYEALKEARKDKYFKQIYDTNGDGMISQEEWDDARKKITAQVMEKNAARQNASFREIKKGSENKIFIISNKSEKELTSGLFKTIVFMLFGSLFAVAAAILDLLMRLDAFPQDIKDAKPH